MPCFLLVSQVMGGARMGKNASTCYATLYAYQAKNWHEVADEIFITLGVLLSVAV